jgi:hypothetical protein
LTIYVTGAMLNLTASHGGAAMEYRAPRILLLVLPLVVCAATIPSPTRAEDVMVYTAHQEWPSRIYVLNLDGTVRDYFEYDFYRLVDVTVVDHEVYVVDAFAPRLYKVDLVTGDLDVVVDDWSLFYFYGVACDGTYFYIDEWDLNRYDLEGHYMGRASCDEYVLGSTWDGSYYWTINDTNEMKCWDISGWPAIVELPENAIAPPTPACRGLWFDGEYFWTAESRDATLGQIFRFDYDGTVIEQWTEPAFRGWAACVAPLTTTSMSATVDPMSGSAMSGFALGTVSPGPASSLVEIRFALPHAARTRLSVYNVLGRVVATIIDGDLGGGSHTASWQAGHHPAGIYFLSLDANGQSAVRKIAVAR